MSMMEKNVEQLRLALLRSQAEVRRLRGRLATAERWPGAPALPDGPDPVELALQAGYEELIDAAEGLINALDVAREADPEEADRFASAARIALERLEKKLGERRRAKM